MPNPMPTRPAPQLDVPTVGGKRLVLSEQDPDRFTLLVFYRGLHCPVCKSYLQQLEGALDDFAEQGADVVVAVSMDDARTAEQTVQDWHLDRLTVGYGLDRDTAESWGLYFSKAINDGEPDLFSEPGLFLVRPDGSLYYVAVNSMPFGRPKLGDMVKALAFVNDKDYPPRGEAS